MSETKYYLVTIVTHITAQVCRRINLYPSI